MMLANKLFVAAAVFTLLSAVALPQVHAGDFKIIAHEGISKEDLKDWTEVFLGKRKRWADGKRIRLAHYDRGDLESVFCRVVVSKTRRQYASYWRKMVFTGKGTMPMTLENEEAMTHYVSSTPGAVGFVGKDTKVSDVAVAEFK